MASPKRRKPDGIEVVLRSTPTTSPRGVAVEGVTVRYVTLPAGLTMGQMNRACFAGSTGRFVMLMNDDVIVRARVGQAGRGIAVRGRRIAGAS
jgi:hypothetical protein